MTGFLDGLGDILVDAGTGAAKGAAAGSFVPGFGTALGAAAGAVIGVAPQISKWVFGEDAAPTIEAVKQAVTEVTGTSDPEAQRDALKNEGMADDLRLKLAEIDGTMQNQAAQAAQAQLDSILADRKNSRDTMLALEKDHSWLQYGAAVASLIFVFGWFGTIIAHYAGLPNIGTDDAATLRNVALAAASYWIGSSAGSASKDRRAAKARGLPAE